MEIDQMKRKMSGRGTHGMGYLQHLDRTASCLFEKGGVSC